MALFGFDAPTNETNPNNQQQWSWGSGSSGGSAWQDPATVWGTQGGYLNNLYGAGNSLMNNFGGYQGQAQNIFGQMQQGIGQIMNQGVNPQLGAYSQEVQRNLEQNILPTIQSQAGSFGQMGGSRGEVAQGVAMGQANQDITNMASNLYNADQNRRMQALSMMPGMANFGMSIPWFALQQMSGILGDPTVLAGGGGREEFSEESSGSYGYDFGGGGGGGGGGFNIGWG